MKHSSAFTLNQLAKACEAQLVGADCAFNNISIDSRTLSAGDVFLAIAGDRFDGHNFIEQAKAHGAIAAIVEKTIACELPTITVDNSLAALTRFAAYCRHTLPCPLIAVTGSCGKTTTRAMMATIMQGICPTLASERSFNNHIGVPLVLSRLRKGHQVAVIEIGANHHGEIRELSKLAQPQVAVITMIGPVHLDGFGDLVGVARAKAEIFEGLAADGTAVIPYGTPYEQAWRQIIGQRRIIDFGVDENAMVHARDCQIDAAGCSQFTLVMPIGECRINLPLLGQHNISNALAAAAACYALSADLAAIKQGLAQCQSVDKRLNVHHLANGATVIDDSYNANAAAATAAIDVLMQQQAAQRIFVLGDMAELGEQGPKMHSTVGEYAKQQGIDYVLGFGELSRHMVDAFGDHAWHFNELTALVAKLQTLLQPSTVALVKGSRNMAMERVVQALLDKNESQ